MDKSSWEMVWTLAAVVLIGLVMVTLFVIVGALTIEEVTVEMVSTTPTTLVVDELIPAISITAPPPTLSQRAETYALDTREQTEGDWVDSLSEVDLIIYVRGVCDEFDRGLWFWDMYERRLDVIVNQGWTSDADAVALSLVMADGVLTFCEYNVDRLPSEFLGD